MINKMFSIYDFLGYLVPGIFLVTNTYWIAKLEDKNYRFEEIKTLFGKINGVEIEKVFVLIFYFCHNKNIDFLRIIYHEIVEESTSHFPKIQNYVALYGFARTITLVLNISTYFLIIRIFNINMKNVSLWVFAFFLSFSSFLMYCCYNKFLRKYNLEILMAYLVKMKVQPQINNCNKKCS